MENILRHNDIIREEKRVRIDLMSEEERVRMEKYYYNLVWMLVIR